jgi:hypothetical protein
MIKVLSVSDVSPVREPSRMEKISVPDDGGGSITTKKNVVYMPEKVDLEVWII